jgi:hypothetical protein
MQSDSKWKKTITAIVAICKAASQIENIDVVVSFRSTNQKEMVYVAVVYDSKIDPFSKVLRIFPSLGPNGGTPEGLSFQAISNLIPDSDSETDSFFLNISDGQPCFQNTGIRYFDTPAHDHTRKQVNLIRSRGIKILSFFISHDSPTGASYQRDSQAFTAMYGKDARMIDVKNMHEVAQAMNKAFLMKD